MASQKPVGKHTPLITVLSIVLLCIVGFIMMWDEAGGPLPGDDGYEVVFRADDVKNLQEAGDVRIAGVKVGTVIDQKNEDGKAEVRVRLEEDYAPLHKGATVRVGLKQIIGQSYVEIVDGEGKELDDGVRLADDQVIPAVDIDELVGTFDKKTQKGLSNSLTALGSGTAGTRKDLARLLEGMGMIGREGYTAVDAIAAQSEDLGKLVREATEILAALNTGRDQLSQLVGNAQTLTGVTSGQKADLAATVQRLPALVDSANRATSTFKGLARDLSPVARDLDKSAPALSAALADLPSVTGDLRGLLPAMDSSLGRADKTLNQVPDLSTKLGKVIPELNTTLDNLNPMVEYLQPYGVDIGTFFGNFGSSFDTPVENGVRPVRLAPIFSEYSVRNLPLDLQKLNPLHWNNPYPAPKSAGDPQPYRDTYPRVHKDE